jgi:hypothetical protein
VKPTTKKQTTAEENNKEVQEIPAPNFTKSALTMFKNADCKWVLGRIKIDPMTQQVDNNIETIHEDLSREEITQRFKMQAAKEFING